MKNINVRKYFLYFVYKKDFLRFWKGKNFSLLKSVLPVPSLTTNSIRATLECFFCFGGFSEHFPRLCPFLGPRRPTQTLSHYTRAELKEGRISLKVRICWPWRIRRERVKEAKVPNVFYNVLTDRMDLDILHVLEYIKVYLTNFPIKHKTF